MTRVPVVTHTKEAAMPERSGGVHWELGEARKLITDAQLGGDAAAETLGWMRLADALVNAASSGTAEQLVPMLLALRQARAEAHAAHAERRTDAIVSEHNQSMLIDQAEIVQAEQGQQAARLGIAEAAILALVLAKAVSKADRVALAAQIAELEARVVRLEAGAV
jgi:hypothetical protein